MKQCNQKKMCNNNIFPDIICHITTEHTSDIKFKVGVLHPIQQPGSYWDGSSELPLVEVDPTEVTAQN